MKQEFGGARLEATTQGTTDDCTKQDGTVGLEQRRLERERHNKLGLKEDLGIVSSFFHAEEIEE